MIDWVEIYARLRRHIEGQGIKVEAWQLGFETTGVFDGLTITTNSDYDWETRCHNVAHSFGHIAQWCLDYAGHQALYEQLHAAKANKDRDPDALEQALARFRIYEEEASEYGVWLLAVTDCFEAIPAFNNFARADIEVIVSFHRDGQAPVWHEFFARWNAAVARGELVIKPFRPRPIPPFNPIRIAPQEVIQEVDGKP